MNGIRMDHLTNLDTNNLCRFCLNYTNPLKSLFKEELVNIELDELNIMTNHQRTNYNNNSNWLKDQVVTERNSNETTLNMIEKLLNTQVHEFDGLPTFICLICYDKLVESYNFQKQCIQSMESLSKFIKCKTFKDVDNTIENVCNCKNANCTCKIIDNSIGCFSDTTENMNFIKSEDIGDVFAPQELIIETINVIGLRKQQNQDSNLKATTNFDAVQKTSNTIQPKPIRTRNRKTKTEDETTKKTKIKKAQKRISATGGRTKSKRQYRRLPIICPICGVLQRYLASHMDAAHDVEGPYECDFCGKSYKSKRYLTSHFKIHMDIRRHKCTLCGKAFVDYTSLRVHMLHHTNERKYKCKICDRAFQQSCGLGAHMKIHLQKRDHKCAVCDLCFYSGSDLKKHEGTHNTEYTFFCDLCTKAFKTKTYLNRHRISAHIKLPIKCDQCGELFHRLMDYNRHKKQHEFKII